MAEIKIEKRKPIWPWIAVVVVLGALVYYIFVKDHEVHNDNSVEIENTKSVE